jgi:hypothetical protein
METGGENEYILIFPGEKLVYTHFSGGKNEYVTPALDLYHSKLRIGMVFKSTPRLHMLTAYSVARDHDMDSTLIMCIICVQISIFSAIFTHTTYLFVVLTIHVY